MLVGLTRGYILAGQHVIASETHTLRLIPGRLLHAVAVGDIRNTAGARPDGPWVNIYRVNGTQMLWTWSL